MTARLSAERDELQAILEFIGGRNFRNAGDAAELRESLQAVTAERDRLRGEVEAATARAAEAENDARKGDAFLFAGGSAWTNIGPKPAGRGGWFYGDDCHKPVPAEPLPADEDWYKPFTTAIADIMDPLGR